MRKVLVLAALLLWASAAHAGSITIQVVQTGQPTVSKAYAIADADIPRIIAAYQIAANAAVNAPATRNQVLLYWIMNTLITPTVLAVQSYETQAAVQALPAVTPINPQ